MKLCFTYHTLARYMDAVSSLSPVDKAKALTPQQYLAALPKPFSKDSFVTVQNHSDKPVLAVEEEPNVTHAFFVQKPDSYLPGTNPKIKQIIAERLAKHPLTNYRKQGKAFTRFMTINFGLTAPEVKEHIYEMVMSNVLRMDLEKHTLAVA